MADLTVELPPRQALLRQNQARWSEILSDPQLARIPGRVETDRFGRIIMSPPPSAQHGSYQARISHLLSMTFSAGRVITECPVSTADGVKAADVAWASPAVLAELADQVCFPRAPEICVEIVSPGNSEAEIREKMQLYFDAGAREFWRCSAEGLMTFCVSGEARPRSQSPMCPDFPAQITL